MKFLSSQGYCPRAWSKGNGCQEKTAMGWFPWPCPLLVIYGFPNFRFCAEHFLRCVPEPWWCFFSFSWNGSATFRKRDFLLSSTQKKIKMQVILLQIPETPTFGDIPELGWQSHPGIRSWCHKNQCFLGTSLKKKNQNTGLSIEFGTLGFIRGQSQAPGAVLGTGMLGQDKDSVGLGRRCKWAASSVSPAQPESDKKWIFQSFQKSHLFLCYLNLWKSSNQIPRFC